jgi:hypothetical protein
MRFDPGKQMRRPVSLELPDYWDKLEAELRDRIRLNPPRRSHRRRTSVARMLRTMVRPALHGGMAVVMAAVLVLSGRPSPGNFGLAPTGPSGSQQNQVWVSVVEVLDPHPTYIPFRLVRPRPRFVNLIPATAQAFEPQPEFKILVRV